MPHKIILFGIIWNNMFIISQKKQKKLMTTTNNEETMIYFDVKIIHQMSDRVFKINSYQFKMAITLII